MSSVINNHDGRELITELDSDENMVAVEKNAAIWYDTENKVDASPFTPDYQAMEKVSIVDASV